MFKTKKKKKWFGGISESASINALSSLNIHHCAFDMGQKQSSSDEYAPLVEKKEKVKNEKKPSYSKKEHFSSLGYQRLVYKKEEKASDSKKLTKKSPASTDKSPKSDWCKTYQK